MAALIFTSSALVGAQGSSRAPRPAQTTSTAFQSLSAKATAAQNAGNLDEAVPLFRKALALNPRWDEGWWSLGEIDYGKNRYRDAAGEYRKAAALDPKSGIARIMLGLCEFQLGQDAAALSDIEAGKDLGIEKDQQLRDVVAYHEAVLLQRAGRFEAAKEALSSLCRNGVRTSELASVFGMVALRMRDVSPPDSSSDVGQVVQHVGRAACLSGAKEYDKAKTEFDEVVANNPHFPLLHYAYGCELIDAQDLPAAVKEFETEIAEQPKSVLPRLRIAAAEYKVDSAAGLRFAQEVVQLEPTLPLGRYLLGLLLLDTGSYKDAVPQLEIARKAFPEDGRIDIALATAYAHVDRPQDAARARAEFARKKQEEQTAAQGGVAITDAMDSTPKQ